MTQAHFLKGESLDRLPVKIAEEIRLLPLDEIEFCHADNGYIVLVTATGEFRTGLGLSELEARLESWGFFRCHRAYLVNLRHIRSITVWTRNAFSLFLNSKREVPLSKYRLRALRELLGW